MVGPCLTLKARLAQLLPTELLTCAMLVTVFVKAAWDRLVILAEAGSWDGFDGSHHLAGDD